MNQFNEPRRLNRFIELERLTTITPCNESTETRFERVRRQIDAAIRSVTTKRNHHVRFNRTE